MIEAMFPTVARLRWQKLANIPKEWFEADLADPAWSPTTTGLIERQEARGGPPPCSHHSINPDPPRSDAARRTTA
jgi:hypothetical protein